MFTGICKGGNPEVFCNMNCGVVKPKTRKGVKHEGKVDNRFSSCGVDYMLCNTWLFYLWRR